MSDVPAFEQKGDAVEELREALLRATEQLTPEIEPATVYEPCG